MGSSTVGVRPNSPPQITSVSSSIPRCLRSARKAAIGRSHWRGQLAVAGGQVVVVVPRLAVAVPELDEANAALEQPPGRQELSGMHAGPVHAADRLGLLVDVKGVGRLRLHAIRQLERLNARLELGLVPASCRDGAG